MSEEKTDKRLLFQDLTPGDVRKTAGERIHNELTYRGVDWIANTVTAISFAYFAERTHLGRRLYFDPAKQHLGAAISWFNKDPKRSLELAENGVGFLNITIGGLAIVPILSALERDKDKIVESIDRRIYGNEQVDNDPRFSIRYKSVELEPHKGFWTGTAARWIVLAPMLYAHMAHKPTMKRFMYEPIGDRTKWVAENTLKVKPPGLLKRDEFNTGTSDWDFIHQTTGMDLGLTFIYSFAHEHVFKALSNVFHAKKEAPQDPNSKVSAPDIELKSLLKEPEPSQGQAHG